MNITNEKIISVKELNQVLSVSYYTRSEIIPIYFKNPIEKIDIVFIAGLALSHKLHKNRFKVDYKGEFIRIFEIRQYLKQLEALYNIHWNSIFETFKGISSITDKDYHASTSFTPIFIIDSTTIKNFFITTDSKQYQFELLKKYIDEKLLKTLNNRENKYFLEKGLEDKLYKEPQIFGFIFTVLYNKIKPFYRKKSSESVKIAQERVEELWAFCGEFIKGLHELAKNIVEHSDITPGNGMGVISVRAYNDPNSNKVLETYVFDFGSMGIVPKLITDTEKNRKNNPVYEDDLIVLKSGYTMSNFIRPEISTKLNQQLYRELAHYGLMTFYNLIEKNEGYVVVASWGKSRNRDLFSNNDSLSKKTLSFGTSYYFQLPFNYDLFKVQKTNEPEIMQGSSDIINGLFEIIKMKIIDEPVSDENLDENCILNYNLNGSIFGRDDEKNLLENFNIIKEKTSGYIAINMEDIELSSSSLLRLLSYLSKEFSNSFIIYNLSFAMYSEMLENNISFYNSVKEFEMKIPYWYENKGILIYSSINDPSFYFADFLYGQTEQEFYLINKLVSNTYPNASSITNKSGTEVPKYSVPGCLNNYFFKSSLLPFDILLKNKLGTELFQVNLETLLNQELKIE